MEQRLAVRTETCLAQAQNQVVAALLTGSPDLAAQQPYDRVEPPRAAQRELEPANQYIAAAMVGQLVAENQVQFVWRETFDQSWADGHDRPEHPGGGGDVTLVTEAKLCLSAQGEAGLDVEESAMELAILHGESRTSRAGGMDDSPYDEQCQGHAA